MARWARWGDRGVRVSPPAPRAPPRLLDSASSSEPGSLGGARLSLIRWFYSCGRCPPHQGPQDWPCRGAQRPSRSPLVMVSWGELKTDRWVGFDHQRKKRHSSPFLRSQLGPCLVPLVLLFDCLVLFFKRTLSSGSKAKVEQLAPPLAKLCGPGQALPPSASWTLGGEWSHWPGGS